MTRRAIWLQIKPCRPVRRAAVLVGTLAGLLSDALPAQSTRPAPPSPPASTPATARARENEAAMAALASRFYASKFRAQMLQSGTLVKGPVVSVPLTQQPVQGNANPKNPSQIKVSPPPSSRQELMLTEFPSAEAQLVEGCDPGFSRPPPLSSFTAPGCPNFKTSLLMGPSRDSIFPGRTVAVYKDAQPGSSWSNRASDVFSFKRLSPGYRVSRYQIESMDLSPNFDMSPECAMNASPGAKVEVLPSAHAPVTTWDDTAQTLRVDVDGWGCKVWMDKYSQYYSERAAYYAITVWVTGPKGVSPWAALP